MRKYAKIALVVVFVLLAGIATYVSLHPNSGTLTVHSTPSDATLTLDGKQQSGTTYRLSPGKHTVTASKDGYLSQAQTVTIQKGKRTEVTIALTQKTTDNIVNQEVTSTVYKRFPNYSLRVLATRELYDGQWIVARVQGNSDPAVVVLKHDGSETGYSVYAGPGTSFDQDFVSTLPPDVQLAMKELR